jgi:hypothetical protein
LELFVCCEFLHPFGPLHSAVFLLSASLLIEKSCAAVVSRAMALFRRLTSFNKSKKPGEDGKANVLNGTSTGTSTTAQPSTTAKSNTTNGYAPEAVKHEEPTEDVHAATRADVASTFEQYAQLTHASRRPLPNQSGDGAYLEKDEPSSFWSDMRSIGIKDLKTVKHIMVRTACMRCGGPHFSDGGEKRLESI